SNHVAPELLYFDLGVLDVVADRRPHFDHRLVHLGLHTLLQENFPLLDDFSVNVRAEIASNRINSLVLFLDPDGESRFHNECNAGGSATCIDAPVSFFVCFCAFGPQKTLSPRRENSYAPFASEFGVEGLFVAAPPGIDTPPPLRNACLRPCTGCA